MVCATLSSTKPTGIQTGRPVQLGKEKHGVASYLLSTGINYLQNCIRISPQRKSIDLVIKKEPVNKQTWIIKERGAKQGPKLFDNLNASLQSSFINIPHARIRVI